MAATLAVFEYFVETGDSDILTRKAAPVEQTDITPSVIMGVAEKTSLTPSTVSELLHKGWRYVERINEISRWEHPMWRLTEKSI